MKKLVALTGAGISAESGLATFRDSGGLWEGHKVEEVATPQAWQHNPAKVLDFYNQRRKGAAAALPNRGHVILAELQHTFDTTVITQNVDDLHERAGSEKVVHLHGSLFESRSSADPSLVYPIDGWELKIGDTCELGSQLRPNIVWFGEIVWLLDEAVRIASSADIFVVVGTSMLVYPAASLVDYVGDEVPKFVVDPKPPVLTHLNNCTAISEKAGVGMEKVKRILLNA